MLITSNFVFVDVLQTCINQALFGKGLKENTCIVEQEENDGYQLSYVYGFNMDQSEKVSCYRELKICFVCR